MTKHHVKKTLPPTLLGFGDEAEIKYYIKVTVVRPQFYRENIRDVGTHSESTFDLGKMMLIAWYSIDASNQFPPDRATGSTHYKPRSIRETSTSVFQFTGGAISEKGPILQEETDSRSSRI